MASKVWFITGTSKGFGRVWAEAALGRGDRVAATARDVNSLAPLVERYGDRIAAITLDVTAKVAVERAIRQAHARFGRIDVVINNAGYGLFGAIEEVSEAQARAQLETNLFGALWVTQAALPIMRAQGSGHIIQVSSIGGVNAFPTVGLYHASKWALEGLSQSLAAEVAGFGIKVTLVEPGGYATDWGGPSAIRAAQMPEYDGARHFEARRLGGSAAAHLLRLGRAAFDTDGVRPADRDLGEMERFIPRGSGQRGREPAALAAMLLYERGGVKTPRNPRMRWSRPFLPGDVLIEREPRRLAIPPKKAHPPSHVSTLFDTVSKNRRDQRIRIANAALGRALNK
jgi:NAD(P)-dependent dehydrogenase (short-subunit alcohol dehydrogenase family)